jgi:GTP-binding protein
VLLVDGHDGPNPIDADIAKRLRQSGRPLLLAVNKLDEIREQDARHAFHDLGLGDPMPVSAASGKGTGDLLDEIVRLLPEKDAGEDAEAIRVAVIGRPNAGKSSLVNKLLGEERHVVTPIAGTTRDAIDSSFTYHGRHLVFVDTAGLRRKAKVEEDLEFYSAIRTERSIGRADVCVLVVDAERGLHNQDLRIATSAWEHGTGLVIVVNKWDLIPEKDANTAKRGEEMLVKKAPFLEHVPFIYGSALTGQRVRKVLDLILEVAEARDRRIATAEVNEVLRALVERNAPPQEAGEGVRLLYAS